MAGVKFIAELMQRQSPHTFNALTKLVMAMADVAKNAGKKTLFGRDKGQLSYAAFLTQLKATVQCMVLDGLVSEATPSSEVGELLHAKLLEFSLAYPNWQDAYGFAAQFFGAERQSATATIERIRSVG